MATGFDVDTQRKAIGGPVIQAFDWKVVLGIDAYAMSQLVPAADTDQRLGASG